MKYINMPDKDLAEDIKIVCTLSKADTYIPTSVDYKIEEKRKSGTIILEIVDNGYVLSSLTQKRISEDNYNLASNIEKMSKHLVQHSKPFKQDEWPDISNQIIELNK